MSHSGTKKKCTLMKLDSLEKEAKEISEQVAKKASARKKPPFKIELSDRHKYEIQEAFNVLDSQGTGFIEVNQLKIAIKALGFEGTNAEVKKMTNLIETDGYLSVDDFLTVIAAKMTEKDSKEDITKSFRLMDLDGTKTITFENLKTVSEELGANLTDEELREMIQAADRNLNGEVTEQEFLKFMKKRK